MIAPAWLATKTQPIGIDDVLAYMVEAPQTPASEGREVQIGGPDVLNYAEMMQRVARIRYNRRLPIISVPLLTPRLSSHWLALVTTVNAPTGRNLIDSMSNEVIVTDPSINDVVPGPTMGYDDAVRQALADRAADPHAS